VLQGTPATPVSKVIKEKMDTLAKVVLTVKLVQLERQALLVMPAKLVTMARPDQLVLQERQDPTATAVLQERLDLLVNQVTMVGKDLQVKLVPQDPTVLLVQLGTQEPQVKPVQLVYQGRKVILELLVPLDLEERKRRDQLALLVKQALTVTREVRVQKWLVFQVQKVLQVSKDPLVLLILDNFQLVQLVRRVLARLVPPVLLVDVVTLKVALKFTQTPIRSLMPG